MSSIDKNQKEKNHQDLYGNYSIKKIKELAEEQTCFFCTSQGSKGAARPMSVLKVDDDGNLWFLSANDSSQNREIEQNDSVNIYFQGSSHSHFMHLSGKATITEDKDIIKELWNPFFKTWFTEGEDDPRISVIQFTSEDGYYWDTKHGNFISGIKILIGAATGHTLDDSIQGVLKTELPHKNNNIAHG